MSALALLGGSPLRTEPFPPYNVIGPEEKAAVNRVLDSGVLSKYLGAWHDNFLGGPEVRALEAEWAAAIGTRFAIAVNSCTSGLQAAIGAAGCGPGDEVIVTPLSMSASATAPLCYGAVPVFGDIDPETFCLTPESIAARITPRTKAVIVVHICGNLADMDPIMEIARRHDLTVIEDCAQSPLARYKGRYAGALGHVGVFSLNYHKHIHTGEGGVATTDDPRLAERLQLIRNHAEAVVEAKGTEDLNNMWGFNFRMGEMEAAIARCQLRRAPDLIARRLENVRYLERALAGLPGLTMPVVRPGSEHVYYTHVLGYDPESIGVARELVVQAVAAELPFTQLRESEGKLIRAGYAKPLNTLPLFQKQIAVGGAGFPFKGPHYNGQHDYSAATCPVAHKVAGSIILHELMRPSMTKADMDTVVAAFHKVWENAADLRRHAAVTGS